MPTNPTDDRPYSEFCRLRDLARAALGAGADDGLTGAFVGWRLQAEDRDIDAAGRWIGGYRQTPNPNMAYPVWYFIVAPFLLRLRAGARAEDGTPAPKGTGFDDLAMDAYRIFGGDNRRWTAEAVIRDIDPSFNPDDATAIARQLFR